MSKLDKIKDPMPINDSKYDDLVEQTNNLLGQARDHNMQAEEIMMKFHDLVSELSAND